MRFPIALLLGLVLCAIFLLLLDPVVFVIAAALTAAVLLIWRGAKYGAFES